MKIDDKLILYLEGLSCLDLSDSEKTRLKADLKKILDGMECLADLNTEDVPERSHPFDHTNAFRDDVVQASYARELILKNAPDRTADMFSAPKTVE